MGIDSFNPIPPVERKDVSNKTLKDLVNYFDKSARSLHDLSNGGKSEYYKNKAIAYEALAQALRLDKVQRGEGRDILEDALKSLDEDYGIVREKGDAQVFGTAQEDVSQLREFVRSQLNLPPSGMSEADIQQAQNAMKNLKIK